MNPLMNQPCRVRKRLFSQRAEGAGYNTHGRVRARRTIGMPRKVGLANWSNRLNVMVSVRGLF